MNDIHEIPIMGKKYYIDAPDTDKMIYKAVHQFKEDMHIFPTDISLHYSRRLPIDQYWVMEITSPPIAFTMDSVVNENMQITYRRVMINLHYRKGLNLNEVRCVSLEEQI